MSILAHPDAENSLDAVFEAGMDEVVATGVAFDLNGDGDALDEISDYFQGTGHVFAVLGAVFTAIAVVATAPVWGMLAAGAGAVAAVAYLASWVFDRVDHYRSDES